jgi:hypothetical protein
MTLYEYFYELAYSVTTAEVVPDYIYTFLPQMTHRQTKYFLLKVNTMVIPSSSSGE